MCFPVGARGNTTRTAHERHGSEMRRASVIAAALVAITALPALAHEERESRFPSGNGTVPVYRTTGPTLVVCKPDTAERVAELPEPERSANLTLLASCEFEHIQAAVDAVTEPGSRILVMPGVYREEPSLAEPSASCAEVSDEGVLTYEQQEECPHNQNLIGIFGDGPDEDIACDRPVCKLQIEGTGATPDDVLLDVGFTKLNGIRADRADGIYLRNFTVQKTEFNSIYVIETDGFAIDRMVARWNLEYGFLTFASDHGLYVDCEAFGNGDAGVYPGSAADHHGSRPAIEITRCFSHHNNIGYSGTAGNSIYAHDNVFAFNGTGATMDSFFPDHPGLPQDSARFEDNLIHSNNSNYFDNLQDGDCDAAFGEDRDLNAIDWEGGVVCPVVQAPVGTGVLIAGGNSNVFTANHIYDNWRFGTMQHWVPAFLRDELDPMKQYDTSHFNQYVSNAMGVSPDGELDPNGVDFWWDEEGAGNCWSGNGGGEDGISSDPAVLPSCDDMPLFSPGNPVKQALLVPCAMFDPAENPKPTACDWMDTPSEPQP